MRLSWLAFAWCIATAHASPLISTAHPVIVKQIADDGSWLVACEARKDTDGDSKILSYGFHGHTYEDDLVPYLIVYCAAEAGRVDDRSRRC
jgi:hypothetical protein